MTQNRGYSHKFNINLNNHRSYVRVAYSNLLHSIFERIYNKAVKKIYYTIGI